MRTIFLPMLILAVGLVSLSFAVAAAVNAPPAMRWNIPLRCDVPITICH